MAAHMDFERARQRMHQQGIDALLLCSPENFYYATGCSSMLVWLYRHAALGMVLFPTDPALESALLLPAPDVDRARGETGIADVCGIPVWFQPIAAANPVDAVAALAAESTLLPEQYDRAAICAELARILAERGLAKARIGIDLDFVDVNTFVLLQTHNPAVEFVDATALLYELRAVKNSHEIALLRSAAQLTAVGITAAGWSIARSSTVASITEAFVVGVWQAARGRGLAGELGSMDGQPALGYIGSAPGPGELLPPSTTVKFDVQVSVGHYYSDLGRTYVLGPAIAEQRSCWRGLVEAHQRVKDALRPGAPISSVFAAGREALDQAGLRCHSRGHFGHSIGLDPKIEEPPFISAQATQILEPGMVLAVEMPFYVSGIGAFQLEDMCLITATGYEVLDDLPYDLIEI